MDELTKEQKTGAFIVGGLLLLLGANNFISIKKLKNGIVLFRAVEHQHQETNNKQKQHPQHLHQIIPDIEQGEI